MAKLLNEDEFIKNRVDDYLDKSTSEYTRFLESSPNFVTYYQYDRVESTMDKGLENVEKTIGAHSPNRFNKIEKFPLYGMDLISMSEEYDEMGMNTTYEGDAVILPGTLRPYPEDYFVCEYIGEVYLFKINGVNPDTVRNKPFYRINYTLYRKMPKDEYVDENEVTEEYVSVFDNIGTHKENIIKKSDWLTVDQIDKISEELIQRYIRNFYRDRMNIITLYCPLCKWHLYNRYLTRFLMKNELLKINKGFRTDIYLVDIGNDGDPACMFDNYRKTIYYALERKDTSINIREFVELYTYTDNIRVSQFNTWGKNYVRAQFRDKESESTINLFPRDFIRNIKTGTKYTDQPDIDTLSTEFLSLSVSNRGQVYLQNRQNVYDESIKTEQYPNTSPEYIIENVIIDYMNDNLELTTDILDAINNIDFELNIYCYSMVPLLLFVLKKYKNKLQETLL